MRDIDRLYNNGKKKDGVYDKFVKNNPNVASRMFSPAKMSTDEARRNEATYVDYGNELSQMRARALDRFMAENPLPERVSPATPPAIRNNRFYQENSTRPSTFVGNTEKASPYTIGVQDRLSMAVTGKPTAERQAAIDRALAPYLQNREAERVAYYKDKDISEKPVSMLTDEEKQALKAEYEGYDNKNFFERRADLKYNDEYERKQALYPNYRELKNEDAYKALIAHGMTDEEIRLLNESPIDEDEAASLSAKGMTEEQMEELSNQRNAAKQAAMTKFENLVNSVDESWGVTAEDITNMVEDRYANPEIVKEAERRPVSNSLFTLATNPVESALEVGADAYNYMTGRPIQNSQTATELIRNTTTENIDNQLGRTLYGGAMSIGDMAVAAGLGYATGGGSIVSAGIQALEKASQVMGEGVDRRLNPDQIFAEGIASGVTTYVTEKIPMGMLEEVAQKGLTNYTAKEIGKYLGSMFLSEGLQEASEDVADWAADAVIAWDKNEFNTQVQELVSQGMSNKEAALKVIADRGVEMLTDFVIGGIGGAQMGSVSTGLANYLGKYNSNPSVYTNKIMGSKVALNTLLEAGKTLNTDSLTGEDAARVEHAKEVANKPIEDVTEEDIVDLSNVLNEQANEANNYAQTIREINYQASVDQNLKEYRENKTITPAEGETEIERLARKNAESIAVREDKRQQAAQRQREKELLDYQINGLKSKLGKALNNFAEEFENEYAAKTFLENFKDQNAALYSSASLQAYRAGETGQSFATFLENSTEAKIMLESGLSEAYLKTLYYQGQNTRTEEDSLNFRVVQNPNRGLATGGEDELTPLKQKIAKVLGVEVATDFEKAATRGDFSVAIAKIMVNATADNQYTALMHEVFEFARAYNPEGMKLAQKTLVDMLVKKTGERAFFDAVIDYREAYRKAGKDAKNNKKLNAEEKAALMKEANKTTDEAQEEFINDAIAYVFTTDEGIKALTDFLMSDENTTQKEKVSAIQAIKDFVDHLIKTIKNFISKKDNKQLGYKYAEYANFSTEELEKVSRLLTGVLDEARKNLARMTKEQSGESAKGNENKNANVPKSIEISKSELNENLHKVHDMEAIGPVEFYDYVKKTRAEGTSELLQHITSKGKTYANVDKLGKVYVDNGGIKDILRHGKAEVSGSLIEAIIPVLEKGKIVYADYDHKSKNYNTATIVAPVEFKNDGYGANKAGTYYVGVIVKRSPSSPVENQNLHVVDILTIRKGLPNNGPTNNGRIPDAANLNLNDILNYVAADVNIFGDEGSVKFSLDVPVEQTKNLIAVHNLSDEKLMGVLELGGFPMPSIAITKANMDHSKFGPISVVFRRETIDPKANKANKVYSGDAYTPTFPRTGYKVDSNKVWDIENRLSNIMGDMKDAFGYLGIDPDNVTDYLERNNGNVVDAYANKDGLKYAFVKDKGLDFDAPTKEKQLSYKFDNEEIKYIALMFTKEEALKAFQNASETYKEFSVDGRLQKIIEKINAVEKKTLGKFYENHKTTELSFSDFDTLLNSIVRYNREGIEQEIDRKAFNEKIKGIIEKNRSEYEKWVKDLFDGVIIKKGLRNNKDAFTSSGNRRSWDALHYDYTLDNIVKAMKEEPEVGQSLGGYTLLGSVNRKFDSVADIHSEENRLQKMDDDQYSALRGQIQDALYEVAKGLKPNPSWDVLSICSDIAEAVAKRKTRSGIKNFLSEWYSVSEEDMDEIMRIIDEAKSLPTGYFEAKPQRAVGFDEVAAVVLPSDDAEMKKLLDEKNIPVVEYTRGDKQSRIDAVNSVEDIRFSLPVSVDSEGNKLSKGQQDFFADSKVRDDQGHLLVMYHGTPNGTFTVFRGGTYFTNMAWYADRYQNQGASSLGYKKTADNPKTYAAYLNITKPFDTRDPEVRKIWDEQYYQKWDTGEITERGLPDWTSAEGLIEFIEENGYDFDGIIIDEGGVEDGKGGVTSRGFAWIPLKGEDQVKDINNLNPTNNPDYRFSIAVDSKGNNLSKGQQTYFKNSKVRDENGNLKLLYHGTEEATFTSFDLAKMDDGISIFLTDNIFVAMTYAGTRDTINPNNAKDLNQFENAKEYFADFDYDLQKTDDGYTLYADDGMEYLSDDTVEGIMEQYAYEIDQSNINAGIYETYANIENPLEIDANGEQWDEINYEIDGETLETTREIAAYAKEHGYDGVIIKNVYDIGAHSDYAHDMGQSEIVVAFDPSQVKSIENKEPSGDKDMRFSLAVPVKDSEGRKLTEGQQEYFKDSKIVDENGRLKVMYHGTERGGFTVFDPEFSDDGISLFFTDDKDIAKAYSGTDKEIKLYRTVKDLEELIHDSYTHIVKDGNTYRIINGFDDDAETEFEGTFDELKEYVEEQYGVEEATNYKVYLNAENPLIIDAEGNNWDEMPEVVKGLTTTREYAVYAKENGYDSVIINNVVDSGVNADSSSRYKNTQVVIVFDSNQVKSVDNLNPTDNPDIRHSIDVIDPFFDAFREIDEEVKLDESDLEKFIKEKMDLDSDVTQKAVKEVAKNIKKAYGSNIRTDRLAGDIMSVFRYLKSTGNMSMKDLMFVMQDIARPVLEDVKASDPEQEKMYKDFVNTVKKYKISLDAGQMAEVANSFGSYYEFQRAMRGKINLSKDGGTPLDNIWTEICDVSNGHLSYGTNPNDQPLALAEYIHSLAPTYQTQEGESLDDAATDLALEIFRQFYVYQSMTDAAAKVKGELNRRSNEYKNKYKKAYNDAIKQVEAERNLNIQRLANELDDLTAEEQEAIRNGDAINQAVIKNLKEDYQRRLDRLRAQSNERIAREKAKYQNAWITKNLRRERSELKNRVLREVKALQNMIAHPAEGASKHVPINLIKPTIEMLEAINLDNGGRNKTIAERLKKMAEVYETFKSEEYSFDYDERIAGDIKELQEMFEGKSYADLQITELERVIEIVVALKTQIRNANNLILNGKLKDAQEAASSAMTSVRQSRRYDNAAMNALNKYANIHLNAYREFRKLSGYDEGSLMEIYRDLDEGSKKEMQIQKDLGEIFQSVLEGKENQKEVKKFISTKKEDLVDIGMKDRNGKPLLITRAMRMSLIMHSMNAGNMRHVLGSGITIPNMYYFEKGKMDEAYAKGINYRFVDYAELLDAIQKNNTAKIEELTKKAQERVEALKNDLSPWEQRFLAVAEEMFHEKTGQYINETSMALKGYAIARVKNYFPIKTDSHFTSQDWSGLVQNASLEGAGVLKERVISTKPILLEDITNVIERQIRFTSKYAGLAVAIRNFDTIMKQISRGGDGQLHNLYETIDSVWGASDTKWLRNLMQDLQGGRGEKDGILSRLRGQFAGATLAMNVSVALSQAASYPTAGSVLGFKPLMKAMKDMGDGFVKKQGIEELEKINPLLWYRNQGNATQDLADAKRAKLPLGVQKFVNWIEFMDTGTVRTLEYASMYYVDEQYPDLKKGSEVYWKTVSDVFSKVVEETQPNYSVLHRPDILRNPNSLWKIATMFKTQSLQNFGIIYDALGELNAAYRSGNKKWQKAAATKVGNAVGSQVTAATVFSGIKVLTQLLYHRIWKFRDKDGEEDKWSLQKLLSMFGWQLMSTFAGSFIFGSEVAEWVKSRLTHTKYYGVELSTVSMINDLISNINKTLDSGEKLKTSVTEEEREIGVKSIMSGMYNIGTSVGEFTGVPVNNIKNLISAIFFYGADIINGIKNRDFELSNEYDIVKTLTDKDVPNMYERIYEAMDGDPERYDKLVDELKQKVAQDNPDLTEDEVAEKVAENVTKNITNIMKAEYLEGTKSEEEVTEYLEDAKGMDEDDAYFQMKKWEGKSNSEYKVMNDAIEVAADDPTPENRKAVIEEINGLVEHGKEKKNIADSIQRAYKDKYIELYEQGNATNLNAILRTALVTAGFSDEEAKEKISGWLK